MTNQNLNLLYEALDFQNGRLFDVLDTPAPSINTIDWLDKGEWLSAAKLAGAKKIFFVENNPVVVFAECGPELKDKIKAFNRFWCLARPRLLFLASPGEITVYDLAEKPVDENNRDKWKKFKYLDICANLTKVSKELQAYHRDKIESGRLFEEKRFGNSQNRADKVLIRDLKTVRMELIEKGLSGPNIRFAHALIGRSIFIRYLEDRGILTAEYFENVARQKDAWTELLNNPTERSGIDFSHQKTFYPHVLSNKDFTYALFRSLARDFNGDMFPGIEEEEQVVNQGHITLIQDLLYGDVGIQKKLFFNSYRFEIIPLELISSIYEEFYHVVTPKKKSSEDEADSEDRKNSNKRQDGAYYTPPVLVEFVLSRLLTPDVLDKKPRILDPSCGSGIFLVEAFRRIVRYEWYKNNHILTFDRLKQILKAQIAGIEVNEEAARIAAFSLYLSMLHYLEPKDISEQIKMQNRLPNLLATSNRSENYFHSILAANVFDIDLIESNPHWKEHFGEKCADIIIGNPPWGAPENNADKETKERHKSLEEWCIQNNFLIGDKEPSQAFLWRALDFLKEKGKAGMLVSAGMLFKHHEKSKAFRKEWMACVRLVEVFNFSHVRDVFFKGATSPFAAILFNKEKQCEIPVYLWSAKQNIHFKNIQSVLISKNDLRIIRHSDISDNSIWKCYTWGSYLDLKFLKYLENHPHTIPLKEEILFSCVGYKIGNKKRDAGWLTKFKKLKGSVFSRYEKLDADAFEVIPSKVECLGKEEGIYEGKRIIVSEVPRQANGANGRIDARLETESYANNHTFHILKLNPGEDTEWKYSVLIGILWSSLSKYFFFLTTHCWGLWHDKILISERLQLPVIFDKTNSASEKIISIVDMLRNYHPQEKNIFQPDGVPEEEIKAKRFELEQALDEAVFELYDLNEEQIHLIRDLCDVTLPFYYAPLSSDGSMLAVDKDDLSWIETYIKIFCRRWNTYLEEDEEMHANVHTGAHGNMIAVEFFSSDKGDPWDLKPQSNTWGNILEQLGNTLPQPMGTSQILLDGVVHVVSDTGIFIIKRNEKRFWTRSLAREDAEATLCKRMVTTIPD